MKEEDKKKFTLNGMFFFGAIVPNIWTIFKIMINFDFKEMPKNKCIYQDFIHVQTIALKQFYPFEFFSIFTLSKRSITMNVVSFGM